MPHLWNLKRKAASCFRGELAASARLDLELNAQRFQAHSAGRTKGMNRRADWLRDMASWMPEQVRLLGYSDAFCFALCDLVMDARGRDVSVRDIPCAFDGQEGEEALYQFAERIQGLLDVANDDDPRLVAELEEAVRISLITRNGLAGVEDLHSGWRLGLRLHSPTTRRRR
jgi:hypothetical protein